MSNLLKSLFANADIIPFSPRRAKYQLKLNFGLHQ